jgi:hypothetical protein
VKQGGLQTFRTTLEAASLIFVFLLLPDVAVESELIRYEEVEAKDVESDAVEAPGNSCFLSIV